MVAQFGLDSILVQLGVGGIFAVLVIRMVLDFLNRRNGRSTKSFDSRILNELDGIKDTVSKIHEMHDVKDGDGVPVWYTPRSWMQTQKEMMELNLKIAAILKDVMKTVERLETAVSQLNKDLH